ncbi:unnamed protein product [Boreogadus saida]
MLVAPPTQGQVPSPRRLRVKVSGPDGLLLTWKEPKGDCDGYRVVYSSPPGGEEKEVSVDEPRLLLEEVDVSQEFQFRISAVRGAERSRPLLGEHAAAQRGGVSVQPQRRQDSAVAEDNNAISEGKTEAGLWGGQEEGLWVASWCGLWVRHVEQEAGCVLRSSSGPPDRSLLLPLPAVHPIRHQDGFISAGGPRVLLGASGCCWGPQGAAGCWGPQGAAGGPRVLLGAPGCCWLLGAPGCCWGPQGASGGLRVLLGASGCCWGPQGAAGGLRVLLAAGGLRVLLGASGCCWLLGASGCCWGPQGAAGCWGPQGAAGGLGGTGPKSGPLRPRHEWGCVAGSFRDEPF